jgi:hypothetical protein
MAFRTDSLTAVYVGVQSSAKAARSYALNTAATMAASTVSANAVIQVMEVMKSFLEDLTLASNAGGIAQYAKDQSDNQSYDVVAEFSAMQAEAILVRNWVIQNFPISAGGYIDKDIIEADGSITVRQFTTVQSTGLQTVLTSFAATIGN